MLWIPWNKSIQEHLDIAPNKLLLLLAVYTVNTSLGTYVLVTNRHTIPWTAMEYTSHCMVTCTVVCGTKTLLYNMLLGQLPWTVCRLGASTKYAWYVYSWILNITPTIPKIFVPKFIPLFQPNTPNQCFLAMELYGLWALSYPEVASLMIISCDELDQQDCSSADLEPDKIYASIFHPTLVLLPTIASQLC